MCIVICIASQIKSYYTLDTHYRSQLESMMVTSLMEDQSHVVMRCIYLVAGQVGNFISIYLSSKEIVLKNLINHLS